jgi:tRNA G18 (ribose-2'-O)-methylase SpoU
MRKLLHNEIAKNRLSPDNIESGERLPIYVLLDNIRSLYNVGSIFRTSDGAFIEKIFLTGFTPYPPRPEIEKTALGATFTIPWEYYKDPVEIITQLKEQNIKIVSLEHTDSSIPYYNYQPNDYPLCLVIGNEIKGIRDEILNLTDIALEIPMYGVKQSLNVSVAYGIALFDLVRIRKTIIH